MANLSNFSTFPHIASGGRGRPAIDWAAFWNGLKVGESVTVTFANANICRATRHRVWGITADLENTGALKPMTSFIDATINEATGTYTITFERGRPARKVA